MAELAAFNISELSKGDIVSALISITSASRSVAGKSWFIMPCFGL